MGPPLYSKPVGGKTYPPEVIQAYILGKLKNDTVAALGGDIQAVITVPAPTVSPPRAENVSISSNAPGVVRVNSTSRKPPATAASIAS